MRRQQQIVHVVVRNFLSGGCVREALFFCGYSEFGEKGGREGVEFDVLAEGCALEVDFVWGRKEAVGRVGGCKASRFKHHTWRRVRLPVCAVRRAGSIYCSIVPPYICPRGMGLHVAVVMTVVAIIFPCT